MRRWSEGSIPSELAGGESRKPRAGCRVDAAPQQPRGTDLMTRRWLFRLLIIAGVWVGVSRFTEVEQLARTLERGQWQWVLAAALLQILYYLTCAALYHSAFQTVGVPSRVR